MKKATSNRILSALAAGALIVGVTPAAQAAAPANYPSTVDKTNSAANLIKMAEPSADFHEYLIREYEGSDWKNHWLYSKEPPKGPWLDHLAAIGAVVDVDPSLLSPSQQDALTDYVLRFHPRFQFMTVTEVGLVVFFCDTQADCDADNNIANSNPSLKFVVVPTWVPSYPLGTQPSPNPYVSTIPTPEASAAPMVKTTALVKKKVIKKRKFTALTRMS